MVLAKLSRSSLAAFSATSGPCRRYGLVDVLVANCVKCETRVR